MANRVDAIQASVMAQLKQEVAEYERRNSGNRPPGTWVAKRASSLLDPNVLAQAFGEDAVEAFEAKAKK